MPHYLAAFCQKDHQHVIPLCVVEIAKNGKLVTIEPQGEFDLIGASCYLVCPTCEALQRFDGFPVTLCEGLPPIENFQDHKAFR